MLRPFACPSVVAVLLFCPVFAHAGDVNAVRATAGKVLAVKDFLKGLPKGKGGHKAAAAASLETAEAELWKAIKAGGGKESVIRYELPVGGAARLAAKLEKSVGVLTEVQAELKSAQGGMGGHCISARRHVEAAIEQLEQAGPPGKKR